MACHVDDPKAALTERVATITAELSGLGRSEPTFRGIGTLDIPREGYDPKDSIGRKDDACQKKADADQIREQALIADNLLVAHEFFMGDHVSYNIPRGPFRCSHDWLLAMLKIILVEQTVILKNNNNKKYDREDAEIILRAAHNLLAPSKDTTPDPKRRLRVGADGALPPGPSSEQRHAERAR